MRERSPHQVGPGVQDVSCQQTLCTPIFAHAVTTLHKQNKNFASNHQKNIHTFSCQSQALHIPIYVLEAYKRKLCATLIIIDIIKSTVIYQYKQTFVKDSTRAK